MTAAAIRKSGGLWIYNPWLDMMVGCGAWSMPLLALAYLTVNSGALVWPLAFYGLALVFNYPHYMATIYRAYHDEDEFRKYRIFTVHITALLILTLLLSHLWLGVLPWIFTLYLTWSPWHYSGQNYGLFMMFARRAGAKPSTAERRALHAAFLFSYLILVVNFHSGASNDPLFLSLGIPATVGKVLVLLLGAAFIGLSGFGLWRLVGRAGWRPMLPSLTLFSTQFVWFLLPTALALGGGWQIPQSRYSTGVLAVMHSAQYLWITSYYARRESSTANRGGWRPWAYFGVLVAGGIALFVPGPWVASRVLHFDFTASFLTFTALVNIHHFILDGAIWKLRDGKIAALLLNSQQRVGDARAEVGSRVLAWARWLAGRSNTARALRLTTAAALLLWGGFDQVRYYMVQHGESVGSLHTAAMMNPFDASLQDRLGRKQWEAGNTDQAVAAWEVATRANPTLAGPRDALLQALIKQGRTQQALEVAAESLQHSPKDVNLLVNYGILVSQAGRSNEAVESWTKAVTIDPSQSHAHLYLASLLDKQGAAGAAIPHYVMFLSQIGEKAKAESARPEATGVIPVLLRLAQCQARVGHPEQAVKSYELARKLAEQADDPRLGSLAAVAEAEFQANHNQVGSALALYQAALQLDDSFEDANVKAADWYNYGLFLRDQGFASRLVYACLLKSKSLVTPERETDLASVEAKPQLRTISLALEDVQKGVPHAEQLRHDWESAAEEARRFKAERWSRK